MKASNFYNNTGCNYLKTSRFFFLRCSPVVVNIDNGIRLWSYYYSVMLYIQYFIWISELASALLLSANTISAGKRRIQNHVKYLYLNFFLKTVKGQKSLTVFAIKTPSYVLQKFLITPLWLHLFHALEIKLHEDKQQ